MTLTTIHLKPVKSNDLDQVLSLDQLCLGGMWSLDGYQREIDSPNSSLIGLEIADQIIGLGCMWAILEECHITLLAIHPDYQGCGLAKLITYTLLEDAVKRNLERATLEVKENNHAAIALYQKFGFSTAGIRKKYYATGENALIMWRSGLNLPQFVPQLQQWQRDIDKQIKKSNYQLLEFGG